MPQEVYANRVDAARDAEQRAREIRWRYRPDAVAAALRTAVDAVIRPRARPTGD